MKRSITLLLAVFTLSYCYSNVTALTISGIVKDSVTNEVMPFSHVAVGDVVTITNMEGEFVITFEDMEDPVLKVSFMGYYLYSTPVLPDKSIYEVLLQPSSQVLEAVQVITGDWVMKNVYRRMHLNYEMSGQSILGYYKEKVTSEDSGTYYLAEGILDVYLPSNVSKDKVLISPVKTRKQQFIPMEEGEITMVSGHASDMTRSSIWRKDSFVNPDNKSYYDFHFAGKTTYGGNEVYIVEFTGLKGKGNSEGKLFVEDESFAIIRMEYTPYAHKSKFWEQVSWVEEFTEKEGLWHLYRVTYDGKWTEYGSNDTSTFTFNSLFVVNQSKVSTDTPDMGNLLSHRDVFFDEASDFSDTFWDGYNFVKLSASEVVY